MQDMDFVIALDEFDKKIRDLTEEVINSMGYTILRIVMKSNLQIMIERIDGNSIKIDDCEVVSRSISDILDNIDIIDDAYDLEVSSPGIDRPLMRFRDFKNNIGNMTKIHTHVPIDSLSRFTGRLENIGENSVTLTSDKTNLPIDVPFTAIRSAKLVVTDDILNNYRG